jgi:hypothetical protein
VEALTFMMDDQDVTKLTNQPQSDDLENDLVVDAASHVAVDRDLCCSSGWASALSKKNKKNSGLFQFGTVVRTSDFEVEELFWNHTCVEASDYDWNGRSLSSTGFQGFFPGRGGDVAFGIFSGFQNLGFSGKGTTGQMRNW